MVFFGNRMKTGVRHNNAAVIRKNGLPALSVNKANEIPAASLTGVVNADTGTIWIAVNSNIANKPNAKKLGNFLDIKVIIESVLSCHVIIIK